MKLVQIHPVKTILMYLDIVQLKAKAHSHIRYAMHQRDTLTVLCGAYFCMLYNKHLDYGYISFFPIQLVHMQWKDIERKHEHKHTPLLTGGT